MIKVNYIDLFNAVIINHSISILREKEGCFIINEYLMDIKEK